MNNKTIYLLLCLASATVFFNVAAVSAVLPEIARELFITNLASSKIIHYYMLPYGVCALIYAPLTKIITFRRVLAITMCIFALANFICGSAEALSQILVGRILMGFSAASVIPLGLMIIGELAEKNIRGRLVGMFFSTTFISSLLGVVVSGTFDWRWIFWIPFVLAIVLAVLFVVFGKVISHRHNAEVNYIKVLKIKAVAKVFAFIFFMSACYHAVHKWYGIYLDEVYGLDKAAISLFFIISSLGGMCGQNLGGWISDKKGRFWACLIGLVGLGLSIMLLAGYYSLILLAAVIGAISLFWTVGHNGISTVLTDFPDSMRPAIASLNSSVRFLSGGLGFYVSSFFITRSFSLTFLIIGILIMLIIPIINNIIYRKAV